MNIFVTSDCPEECASVLDDLRLRKMVLETAQILSTAHYLRTGSPLRYRPTHRNHPVIVWAAASEANYYWTARLFKCLSAEYYNRFGKIHKSYNDCWTEIAKSLPENPAGPTTFCNCTPYKDLDVFTAYQCTLDDKWNRDKREPKWTEVNN